MKARHLRSSRLFQVGVVVDEKLWPEPGNPLTVQGQQVVPYTHVVVRPPNAEFLSHSILFLLYLGGIRRDDRTPPPRRRLSRPEHGLKSSCVAQPENLCGGGERAVPLMHPRRQACETAEGRRTASV